MSVNKMQKFHRDIAYQVHAEDDKILLTASMKDVYHDIVIDVVVNRDDLVIRSCIAKFHKAPEIECPIAAKKLSLLEGATIGRGITKAVLAATAGETGCVNLKTMLLGLLPIAMNVKAAEGFEDEREMLDSIAEKLAGACAGYSSAKKVA